MAEELIIASNATKEERYISLLPQIEALITSEESQIANLANTAAALKQTFDFFWVGFYLDDGNGQLVLGPFQGPIACTRIQYGKGVCGTSFSYEETILVPNVDLFPGHIACSSESKSEIVIPLKNKTGKIIGVLDVDSDQLDDFDEVDQKYLEKLIELLAKSLS